MTDSIQHSTELSLTLVSKIVSSVIIAVILALLVYIGSTVTESKSKNRVQDTQIKMLSNMIEKVDVSLSDMHTSLDHFSRAYLTQPEAERAHTALQQLAKASQVALKEAILIRIEDLARRMQKLEQKLNMSAHSNRQTPAGRPP